MSKSLITLLLLPAVFHAHAQNKAKFSELKAGMPGGERLKQQAIRIANERSANLRCAEVYSKAVIISQNWELEYDKEGFVKGRKIHMELYCEKPDGCGMADFTFRQKHEVDGDFSEKLLFDKVGYIYYVDCE